MLFPPVQPAYAAAITSSPLAYIVVGLCGAALIAAGIFEVVTGRRVRMRLGGSDSRVAFVRIGGAGSLLFGIFLVEQALEWHSSAQALGFPSLASSGADTWSCRPGSRSSGRVSEPPRFTRHGRGVTPRLTYVQMPVGARIAAG